MPLLHETEAVFPHVDGFVASYHDLTLTGEDEVHGHPAEITDAQIGSCAYLT